MRIRLTLLSLTLFTLSCKDNASEFSKKNGTQQDQSDFFVAFNELDPAYCEKQKNEISYQYNKLIKKRDYYGQMLVAKN